MDGWIGTIGPVEGVLHCQFRGAVRDYHIANIAPCFGKCFRTSNTFSRLNFAVITLPFERTLYTD